MAETWSSARSDSVQGTYTWAWGTGDDRDELIVNIEDVPVSLPATPLLVFLGLALTRLMRQEQLT